MSDEPGRDPTLHGYSALTQADMAKRASEGLLEAALAEQRRDWTAGKRTPAAQWLRRYPALASNGAQAAEIVYHEFTLRAGLGESPLWEDYLRQFAEYAELLRLLRQADEIVEQALSPLEREGYLTAELGDYELLEQIGHGGMGVVFKARQKSLDRIVALKMLRFGEYSATEERVRFHSEAQALARLQHPHVVQIYEVGETAGQPFLCVEFVDGQSLADHLDGTPVPPQQAASLLGELARAMHYAHEKGIIHRDLKPSNILLQLDHAEKRQGDKAKRGPVSVSDHPVSLSDLRPKITDFGVAKRLDTQGDTRSGAVLGTPSYMAPEQADGATAMIDRRTDVYGLGAILYELLTGRPPFRAESPLHTLQQVLEAEPARPRLLNEAVPRDLETVCLQCLRKEPSHRYASAAALADDLARFVNREPVHARPVGPVGRVWRWCRRNPTLAGLAAVLVLAVAGGLSGIVFQWRRAELARREAVASDEEAEQLLREVIQSSPVVPLLFDSYPRVPTAEPLLKAEAHCKNLLRKSPDNYELRVALTNVYGRLGTLYLHRGHRSEADACFQNAQRLWDKDVGQSSDRGDRRDWLATTYFWQAYAALAHNDPARGVELIQSADALWQELAEEQPDDSALSEKLTRSRWQVVHLLNSKPASEECARLLENNKALLEKQIRQHPANRAARSRLALTCLFLGDVCSLQRSPSRASANWQQAFEDYQLLAQARPGDLLGEHLLARSCSRLLHGGPSGAHYHQAVSLFEQVGKRLAAMSKQNPGSNWIREALVENYCALAACHVKAGEIAKAQRTYKECVDPLATFLIDQRMDYEHGPSPLHPLAQIASVLHAAKEIAAALPIARQAAALASRYAAFPSRDLGFMTQVGRHSLSIAGLLNQLGDAGTSLQQAEQARRLFEESHRAVPDELWRAADLSAAWMRIGKAKWGPGQHAEALVAFRESAAIQRQVLERAPSVRAYRSDLSRCYDRLVYWSSLAGDWPQAAAALLEREKLWPNDAKELTRVSRDWRELADDIAQNRKHPLPQEEAQRRRCLTESERTRQLAAIASRRAATGDRTAARAVPP